MNIYLKKVSHTLQKTNFKGGCFAECLPPYVDQFFTAVLVQQTKFRDNEVAWHQKLEGLLGVL